MSSLGGHKESGFEEMEGVDEWHCTGFDLVFFEEVLQVYLPTDFF